MPLLRIQRYRPTGIALVDYFITEGSYNAGSQSLVLQLDPTLFPSLGNYAIIRTTGAISGLASPIGPTPTWTSADSRTISAPLLGVGQMSGTLYSIIYVTVSA